MKKIAMGVIFTFMIVFTGVVHGSVVKWSQLPSMDPGNGYAFSSETQVASQVADDFLNQNATPVIGITWWGAYWDSTIGTNNYYPYSYSNSWGDPETGSPEIVTGFNISFYQDVPEGTSVPPWSHPGAQTGQAYYFDLADIIVQEYGVINRSKTQTVFQYDIVLEAPLTLKPGNIYWLSIQAVDRNGDPIQWGWQESGDHFTGNAVQTFPGNPFNWDMLPGEDMAFELKTVPVPTSLLLMASGLLGFISLRRKSKQVSGNH
ncbi:MAG: PEP-CTERM sorting domain-containing protein [Bacteroidales bacterium]|nr:PEP-CTERM sorting domain-containing protein [Bacteroidales bacterium]